MKKINKVLSLILAIVMIVSMMPMAFAYSYDYEAWMNAYLDFLVNTSNVYDAADEELTASDVSMAVYMLYADALNKVQAAYPDYDVYNAFGYSERLEEMPEVANALTVALNEASAKLEKSIADGTFTVVIDTSKVIPVYYAPFYLTNDEDKIFAFIEGLPAEKVAAAEESAIKSDEILVAAIEGEKVYTQDDYDEAAAAMVEFYTCVLNCLTQTHNIDKFVVNSSDNSKHFGVCSLCGIEIDEPHRYGIYVPNNDATTEADGTKTAVCVDCGVTDTKVDEGSKLEKEEEKTEEDKTENDKTEGEEKEELSFFESIAKMFTDFFESIKNFFKNLFK